MPQAKAPAPHQAAVQHLSGLDAIWAKHIAEAGACTLEVSTREPYEALIQAVANQQVPARAADAVLKRFLALFPEGDFPTPQAILDVEGPSIRACGFSQRKVDTILGICQGAVDRLVPSRAEALKLSDEELIARLVSLKGIGRWTVEMLLMFTLGREDILAVDDFGLRKGYQLLYSLPEMPKPKELGLAGEAWRPHRTVAAWYLWRATDSKPTLADRVEVAQG